MLPSSPTTTSIDCFVLGHRWALETAEPLTVHVVTGTGTPVAPSATLTVATTPALVACKFHAVADRRDARATTRESDALDLLRLVGDLARVQPLVDQLSSAPFDLADLVSAQVERWFIDDALRTARLVNLGAGPAGPPVDAADVATIGRLFLDVATPGGMRFRPTHRPPGLAAQPRLSESFGTRNPWSQG